MKHLLIFSDPKDPIVVGLLENRANLNQSLISISVDQLLNEVIIRDVIAAGEAHISWTLPDGTEIKNDEQTYLINRVSYLDPGLFKTFSETDQKYAYREFWAYLSFALDSFRYRTSTPNFLGLNSNAAPLPLQWKLVLEANTELSVPNYYLGPRSHMPKAASFNALIYGEVYSFYKWNKISQSEMTQLLSLDNSETIFIYERPTGNPIQIFVVGNTVLVRDLESQKRMNDPELDTLGRVFSEIFKQQIGEYLVFKDGTQITFGSAQNQVSKELAADTSFHSVLLNGLNGIACIALQAERCSV